MKRFGWLLGWLLLMANHQAWSQIQATHLSNNIIERKIIMNAQLETQLSEVVKKALHHEIPLHFSTRIQLSRRDQFFIFPYRTHLVDIQYTTQLRYSHFERRYHLHNQRNNNREHFSRLEDALHTLGHFQQFEVAELAQTHHGLRYDIRLQLKLDYWSLPAPLFTEALLNSDWRLTSPWFTSPFETGRNR